MLELDPSEQRAIAYLRDAYEKRRDWEKLIALSVREAEGLPEGGARRVQAGALLATEKIKSQRCIDLWRRAPERTGNIMR